MCSPGSVSDSCDCVLLQPVIRCRPRSLFRSPSMPSPVSRPSTKRPDCPGDENTPVRVKRRRSLAGSLGGSQQRSPDSPKAVSPEEEVVDDGGGDDDDDALIIIIIIRLTGSDVAPRGLSGLLAAQVQVLLPGRHREAAGRPGQHRGADWRLHQGETSPWGSRSPPAGVTVPLKRSCTVGSVVLTPSLCSSSRSSCPRSAGNTRTSSTSPGTW